MNPVDSFKTFMNLREAAARAYVVGNAGPLDAMTSTSGDATFFSPDGRHEIGSAGVRTAYAKGAQHFIPPGDTRFEILHAAESDGLAYWTGYQRATVHTPGKSEPVHFNLRVTEVFQREPDGWRLLHRHADPLPDPGARHSNQ